MYWMIDESPRVAPDVDGEGMQLPNWVDRKSFAFKWQDTAELRMTENGTLAVVSRTTDREILRVTRKAVLDFAKRGTRIYRYSDWIGPLLVTIDNGPGVKVCMPRNVFFEHRDRALTLMESYDKECARIVSFEDAVKTRATKVAT